MVLALQGWVAQLEGLVQAIPRDFVAGLVLGLGLALLLGSGVQVVALARQGLALEVGWLDREGSALEWVAAAHRRSRNTRSVFRSPKQCSYPLPFSVRIVWVVVGGVWWWWWWGSVSCGIHFQGQGPILLDTSSRYVLCTDRLAGTLPLTFPAWHFRYRQSWSA